MSENKQNDSKKVKKSQQKNAQVKKDAVKNEKKSTSPDNKKNKTAQHGKKQQSKKQSSVKTQNKNNRKAQTSQQKKNSPSNERVKKNSGKKKKAEPIKIAFLGGLNEVGKNITLFQYKDDILIIDSGLAFPDEDMPGIDLVIPDFSYLEKNADKIKGICITHGHEDHIGSLAYLLKKVNIPVYSTRLTNGLIEGKLKEHGLLGSAKLNVVKAGESVKIGEFSVEFIHVNHSIPDAVGFAIKCDSGTVVHTGDFKIDTTPIDGGMIDLARFAELGKEGVLCMMADSTNAERHGYTESESKVGASFELLFRKAEKRRIIVATFASNIHRVQQIINVAAELGRKVALSGRSLENVVAVASELGYLKVPDGILVKLDMINRYSDHEIVLITTGSQGVLTITLLFLQLRFPVMKKL